MPTYIFACKQCEHSFELRQSFNDPPPKSCPECGAEIRKVFGNLGVSFRGTGFYRTDSAAKPANKDSSAGTSD